MGLKDNLVKNWFYIKAFKPVFSTLIFVVLALDNLQNIILCNISYDLITKTAAVYSADRQTVNLIR